MIVYKYLPANDQPLQKPFLILMIYSNQGVWLSTPQCRSAQTD